MKRNILVFVIFVHSLTIVATNNATYSKSKTNVSKQGVKSNVHLKTNNGGKADRQKQAVASKLNNSLTKPRSESYSDFETDVGNDSKNVSVSKGSQTEKFESASTNYKVDDNGLLDEVEEPPTPHHSATKVASDLIFQIYKLVSEYVNNNRKIFENDNLKTKRISEELYDRDYDVENYRMSELQEKISKIMENRLKEYKDLKNYNKYWVDYQDVNLKAVETPENGILGIPDRKRRLQRNRKRLNFYNRGY